MRIGKIKRVEFEGRKYWVSKNGYAYRSLRYAVLGIKSPSLMITENVRRYQAKLLGEKF